MQHKQDASGQNPTASPLILLFFNHNLRPQPQKVFFVALRGSKGFKVFSAPLRALRGPKKVFSVPLRGSKGFKMFSEPLRVLRGSKPLKVFFVALRGSKGFKVSSADKKRCSSRSFAPLRGSKGFKVSSADKKRCSSRSFAPLRGSKGFKVFSAPLRLLRGQKRCSPCPSVSLRGQKRCSPRPSVSSADKKRCSSRSFAPLRGSKGFKVFSAPLRALRGQKKVFFAFLRAPSWIKGVQGVLRAPPSPPRTKKVFSLPLRVPPWTKKVFSAPLRALRGQKKVFFAFLRAPSWIKGV